MVKAAQYVGRSTVEVLDPKNGEPIWKQDRDDKNAWANPAIAKNRARIARVVTGTSGYMENPFEVLA